MCFNYIGGGGGTTLGGYHDACGGIMSTSGEYHEYIGGYYEYTLGIS